MPEGKHLNHHWFRIHYYLLPCDCWTNGGWGACPLAYQAWLSAWALIGGRVVLELGARSPEA